MKRSVFLVLLLCGLATTSVRADDPPPTEVSPTLDPKDVPGTYEGTIDDPKGAIRQMMGNLENYIFNITLKSDGTMEYREFHNNSKENGEGITGTPQRPHCPGKYTFKKNIIHSDINCSRYGNPNYKQDIYLDNVTSKNPAEDLKKDGLTVDVKPTVLNDVKVKFLLKKLAN